MICLDGLPQWLWLRHAQKGWFTVILTGLDGAQTLVQHLIAILIDLVDLFLLKRHATDAETFLYFLFKSDLIVEHLSIALLAQMLLFTIAIFDLLPKSCRLNAFILIVDISNYLILFASLFLGFQFLIFGLELQLEALGDKRWIATSQIFYLLLVAIVAVCIYNSGFSMRHGLLRLVFRVRGTNKHLDGALLSHCHLLISDLHIFDL